jgi:hypothetical protein
VESVDRVRAWSQNNQKLTEPATETHILRPLEETVFNGEPVATRTGVDLDGFPGYVAKSQ